MSEYQDACVTVCALVRTVPVESSKPDPSPDRSRARPSSTDGPRRHAPRRIAIEMLYAFRTVLVPVLLLLFNTTRMVPGPPRARPKHGGRYRYGRGHGRYCCIARFAVTWRCMCWRALSAGRRRDSAVAVGAE